MIRALLRYLFFIVPEMFLEGLMYILFEEAEVTGAEFLLKVQKSKKYNRLRHKILAEYLLNCYKQVYKKNEKE